jgi:hypothetical protein
MPNTRDHGLSCGAGGGEPAACRHSYVVTTYAPLIVLCFCGTLRVILEDPRPMYCIQVQLASSWPVNLQLCDYLHLFGQPDRRFPKNFLQTTISEDAHGAALLDMTRLRLRIAIPLLPFFSGPPPSLPLSAQSCPCIAPTPFFALGCLRHPTATIRRVCPVCESVSSAFFLGLQPKAQGIIITVRPVKLWVPL